VLERLRARDPKSCGPVFVSVGDDEKLRKFLELNPLVNADNVFVDDSPERDAYTGQGFGKIGDVKPETSEMSKPGFTPSQWWSYLSNVMSLSPVPKDIKFGEVPQGVLQLGGTFVIEGDDVTYAWADPIPGQHPEPEDVLTAAGVP